MICGMHDISKLYETNKINPFVPTILITQCLNYSITFFFMQKALAILREKKIRDKVMLLFPTHFDKKLPLFKKKIYRKRRNNLRLQGLD